MRAQITPSDSIRPSETALGWAVEERKKAKVVHMMLQTEFVHSSALKPTKQQIEMLDLEFFSYRLVYNFYLNRWLRKPEAKLSYITYEQREEVIDRLIEQKPALRKVLRGVIRSARLHYEYARNEYQTGKSLPKLISDSDDQHFAMVDNCSVTESHLFLPGYEPILLELKAPPGKRRRLRISKSPKNQYSVDVLIEEGGTNFELEDRLPWKS